MFQVVHKRMRSTSGSGHLKLFQEFVEIHSCQPIGEAIERVVLAIAFDWLIGRLLGSKSHLVFFKQASTSK